MKRALHLMVDHVFTRDFIQDAEALGFDSHDFLVYGDGLAGKRFIDEGPNVFRHLYGGRAYRKRLAMLGTHYSHLFVHWLSYEAGEAVLSAPHSVKVGAFFRGNDFAEPAAIYKDRVFEPLTREYFANIQQKRAIKWRNNPRWRYAMNPVWLAKTIANKLAGSKGVDALFEKKKAAVTRLDYFIHFNRYDLDWVNVQTPTKATLVNFFYPAGYSEAAAVPLNLRPQPHVLLGNSASPTNNHLDVLKRLAGLSLPDDVKIVTPLSYGDQGYAGHVIQHGREWLGERFKPVTDYMPRDAYFAMLSEATSAVFNIKRTQALGNINAMLAMGKRVFINAACPTYTYYIEKGFLVHDTESAYNEPALLTKPLDLPEIEHNQNKLTEFFSDERRLKLLTDLLSFRSV